MPTLPRSAESISLIERALATLKRYGPPRSLLYALTIYLAQEFVRKKEKLCLRGATWREINFAALDLKGSGKILLDPDDRGFSTEFFPYGFREPLNTIAISRIVSERRPIVLDVGSNLGYFPLIERQAGAKGIICMEPISSTATFLRTALEGLENISVLNMALAEEESVRTFFLHEDRNLSGLVRFSGQGSIKEISALTTTLSSLADSYAFNMIRMDIEGYEHRILAGKMPDSLDIICIEFHITPPFSKSDGINTLRILRNCGFRASMIIKELHYGYYGFINSMGIKTAYKIASVLSDTPIIRTNLELEALEPEIREPCVLHLILQR